MSTKKHLAELMVSLFEGRNGSYALRREKNGAKYYIPARDRGGKDLPFTVETCLQHLQGEISIGSYPLDQDDHVKWASVDFDGKRGSPLADALIVKSNLEKKGLICWLERSQSGKGIHLWLFFDSKIKARGIRALLLNNIPEADIPIEKRTSSFDRVFPNQDTASGGYGNLCALPLNGAELVKKGNTSFIKDDGTPFDNQSKTIEDIYNNRNKASSLQPLTQNLPSVHKTRVLPVLQEIPGGTKLMAPQGCAWLRKAYDKGKNLSEPEWYAAIGQFAKVEHGEVLAHKFSENYPDYSEAETQKKFDHAKKANKPVTCAFVWENFGDCGKRCGHLGVSQPWQLAKVPLAKLDDDNKGKIYSAKELSDTAIKSAREINEGKRVGFAWGYNLLDDYTELRPRNLIVVAARTGIGKTAALIDASIRGAERGVPQYIISLEMSHEELALRYLARLSMVDHSIITTGKCGKQEWIAMEEAIKRYERLPLFVDDSTRDLDRILDNIGELTYSNGKGPVWVDYLQLIKLKDKETQKQGVDRAVDSYKQMAKILDVPVVALAQLNRSEETSEGDDDLDSWLKDSGNIEQTADVIHYIRGERGPGVLKRKWRLHKERHRVSGVNFRFDFHQGVFKFEPVGFWNKQSITDLDTDEELDKELTL